MLTSPPGQETEIIHQAREALSAQLFRIGQDLTCEFREGLLFLRGRVSTYYQKQIAQEAVRRLEAVEQVINQIEVGPTA